MDPGELLEHVGGVARRADALRAGVSRRALDGALAAGSVVAPARGVLALATVSEARLRAASMRARLTCVSAIAEHGLPIIGRPGRLHVAVSAAGRVPAGDGLRIHFDRDCGRALGPMPVARALDHAGRCVGPRAHLVMLDAALRAGLLTGRELGDWTATRVARREWLLGRADPRAESAQETLARIDLVEAGLAVVPQAYLPGVGRVDLLVEGRLALEVDGFGYHHGDDSFTRDRRRDRVVLRGGILAARLTAAEVERARPGEIARVVRGILDAHPLRRARTPMSGAASDRPTSGSA